MWHWQKATQRYMHNNKLFNGKTYRLRVLKWHKFFIILFKCFYRALFMTLVEPKEIDHCRFPIPKNGREFWNTKIRTAEPTCSFLNWFCCFQLLDLAKAYWGVHVPMTSAKIEPSRRNWCQRAHFIFMTLECQFSNSSTMITYMYYRRLFNIHVNYFLKRVLKNASTMQTVQSPILVWMLYVCNYD